MDISFRRLWPSPKNNKFSALIFGEMESIEFFIPSPKFHFVSIGDLKKIESKRIIDFIAIIKNIGPLIT